MDLMGPKLDPPLEAAAPAASSTTIAKPILCRTVWKFPCGLGERQTPCPLLLALRPWPPFFLPFPLPTPAPAFCASLASVVGCAVWSAGLPVCPPARPPVCLGITDNHRWPAQHSTQHTAHNLPAHTCLTARNFRGVTSGAFRLAQQTCLRRQTGPLIVEEKNSIVLPPSPSKKKKKPQLAMSDVAWLSLNEIDCLSAI